MTHQEVLDYLYEQLPMFQRQGQSAYKKDLGNISKLCEALGKPQEKFKSIHIAGTNGKGSTAHCLSAILQSAGYRTGLYTSPHLRHFTERIKVNGEQVSMDWVADFITQLKPVIHELQPSFFEITVAMSFAYFAERKVDIAVVETGLGGRLDSTNILSPELAIITHIGLDHQAILGDSIEEIAMEKAGIIKKHTPVIISERQDCIDELFVEVARKLNAPLSFADKLYHCTLLPSGQVDIYRADQLFLEGLTPALRGNYQSKNYVGVLMAVEQLNVMGYPISKSAVREGLGEVIALTDFKGRWQVLEQRPLLVCDTAHNESGVAHVVEQLVTMNKGHLYIIWGMVSDKDPERILNLLPKDADYFFCQASLARAMPVATLLRYAHSLGLQGEQCTDVNEAIAVAKDKAGPDDIIFVGGSTFVVAEIMGL